MTSDLLAPLGALPGVADSVAAARAAVDTVLGHRLLRRRSAEVSAEAALRCARASAALAGSDLPLEVLRTAGDGELDDGVVQGALRVAGGLGALVEVVGQAPLQALARLHALAARGLLPDAELGRPSAAPGVAGRLNALVELLTARGAGPAMVLAAVVHGELLTLDAFPPVSGVVARAAGRLVLVARGLDPKALTCPDVGHAELAAGYRDAATAYAAGRPGPWLVHCAEAVRLGAVESLAICEALSRSAETAS